MKKYCTILMAIGLIALCSCNNKKVETGPIIEINITEALENKKDLKLSEFVKDVEIVALESNINCFMESPSNIHYFGKKYILAHDVRRQQFFLFTRKGAFLRKIGQAGKGPGEYSGEIKATMSKDEERIIVSDSRATRVIVYDILGKVLVQKDLSSFFKSSLVMEISGLVDQRITFLPQRPWESREDFASLLFFDYELNKVGEVLPRANDDNLSFVNLRHASIFANKKGNYFCEMFNDTVYQFLEDGQYFPRYRFTVEKNKLTKNVVKSRDFSMKLYDYTFPLFPGFIPGYLVVMNSNAGVVYYDIKKEEAFSLNKEIENDIYGLNARVARYMPDENICADQFRWGDYSEYHDLDPIRKMEVSHPEIRDQLIKYAEDPPDNLGTVIIVMHMK